MTTAIFNHDALSQILDHVDCPSDVLNVALSSRFFYSVAVPQHLHYRDIRTRLQNNALWTWLSRIDDLRASQIRYLTLLPDQDFEVYCYRHPGRYNLRERLPSDFTHNQTIPLIADRYADDCRMLERALCLALKRMTRLQRFRWYRVPRPLLQDVEDLSIWRVLQELGTVTELDLYDREDAKISDTLAIVTSKKFFDFQNLTALQINTSGWTIVNNDPTIPYLFQIMLLNNLPGLQVLGIELQLDEGFDGTANIDYILESAYWPNLRVLRLRGINCRIAPLRRFLTIHTALEDITLARMTPGRLWTRLKEELPWNILPNLRHLCCTPSQAAALVPHLAVLPGLEGITGVELHEKVVEDKEFVWDDEWEDEHYLEEIESTTEIDSPWKEDFMNALRNQKSLKSVGLASVRSSRELVDLSTVAPAIENLHINHLGMKPTSELYQAYSLFPSLEVICGGTGVWVQSQSGIQPNSIAQKANVHIQELAHVCPKLRVILIGTGASKVIIIRENKIGEEGSGMPGTIRWVVRRWEDSEVALIRDEEYVYG